MNINLYLNYYEEQNVKRKAEIDLCINKNLSNPLMNVILLESNSRLKYNDFFKSINEYTSPDDINIIANLDIYFDSTVELAKKMRPNQAFCLCRWDLKNDGQLKFAGRPDSQDSWFIKGPVKNVNGDFCLGFVGCDNRIMYEFKKSGYEVSNPGKSIKSIHVHNSNIRNYKARGRERKNFEVKGPYLTLTPTELKG